MLALPPLEHGGAHRFHGQLKAGERFGMAQKQETADA
jgi:hypothetical protein